jgi:hypothetical protein
MGSLPRTIWISRIKLFDVVRLSWVFQRAQRLLPNTQKTGVVHPPILASLTGNRGLMGGTGWNLPNLHGMNIPIVPNMGNK